MRRTQTHRAQIVHGFILVMVCSMAGSFFLGCSPQDPQRAKDDAYRKAIVGDWVEKDSGHSRRSVFLSDGTYTSSITTTSDSRNWDYVGKWGLTNGQITITAKINYRSWDNSPVLSVDEITFWILRVNHQEFVFAGKFDHGVLGLQTNIWHRPGFEP